MENRTNPRFLHHRSQTRPPPDEAEAAADEPLLDDFPETAVKAWAIGGDMFCVAEVRGAVVTPDAVTFDRQELKPHRAETVAYERVTVLVSSNAGIWAGGPLGGRLELRFFTSQRERRDASGDFVGNLVTVDGVPLDPEPTVPWSASPSGKWLYGFADNLPVVRHSNGAWLPLCSAPAKPAAERTPYDSGTFLCLQADERGCWAGTTRGLVRLVPGRVATEADVMPVGPVVALTDDADYVYAAVAAVPYDFGRRTTRPARKILYTDFKAMDVSSVNHRRDGMQMRRCQIIAFEKKSGRLVAWRSEIEGLVASMAVVGESLKVMPAFLRLSGNGRMYAIDLADVKARDERVDPWALSGSSPEFSTVVSGETWRLPTNWPAPLELPSRMLLSAVFDGTLEEVTALAPRVKNLEAQMYGGTSYRVLDAAIGTGRTDMARVLIEAGASCQHYWAHPGGRGPEPSLLPRSHHA